MVVWHGLQICAARGFMRIVLESDSKLALHLIENGCSKTYYLHLPSKLKLRSQQEVINFLLHGDFPRKGGSKKAKLAEAAAVDNQDSSLASRESNRRAEMSSHFLETDIVNQMKSGEEEESKGGMESANKMKSSDEKESNELDNMNDELKNKMKNLEKEIMPWDDEIGLYEMVDNEIENELMIKELLSQPGELLFLPVEKK
ncbi:hypothetical protein E2542_SST08985 [Spatholobus suberectus]|nr:hypothetical protein E2542_SST08985 [Spatholobus suberectus]